MLKLFLTLCVLGAVGFVAYEVLEEESTEGYSGNYRSEATPRPDYSRVPSGVPDVGSGYPQRTPPAPSIDCQRDLSTLNEKMRRAYSAYLDNQSTENYRVYLEHKRRLDWAIAQCWKRR